MTTPASKRVPTEGNLAWLDLEMTGLDPTTDVILQAALIITNGALDIIEEYVVDVWQPESELAKVRMSQRAQVAPDLSFVTDSAWFETTRAA